MTNVHITLLIVFLIVPKVKKNKNHIYKNQGGEPIQQKYKSNENTSRHNPKKKNENQQSMKNKEKETLCKYDPRL
jgi:hypothetical protein